MLDRVPQDNRLRRAINACLPGLEDHPSFEQDVLRYVRGEKKMKNKPEAVETEAEELLFYSDKERDAALGTIGHLRIDFGRSGEEFNCTWFDHANSGKNDSYFKESFDT